MRVDQVGGSDGNNGVDLPVKTLARGHQLTTNNSTDHLLVKCGGDHRGEAPLTWGRSGRDALGPILVGTYGSGPRPIVPGILSAPAGFVVVQGLAFRPNTRDASNRNPFGINWALKRNLDILDCTFDGYATNVSVEGAIVANGGQVGQNLSVRRCVSVNAYPIIVPGHNPVHSHGIFVGSINGVSLIESVFDSCGYKIGEPGAGPVDENHDAYLQYTNYNGYVNGCMFSRASANGLQQRLGGSCLNTLFYRDPLPMFIGGAHGAFSGRSLAQGCVALEAGDIDASNPRGGGYGFVNCNGADLLDCIASNPRSIAANTYSIRMGGQATGSHDVFVGRCHFWGYSQQVEILPKSDAPTLDPSNVFFLGKSSYGPYPNPEITPHAVSGHASFDLLIAAHLARPADTWDTAIAPATLIAAIRTQGFGI